ncbi:hypothetical protein GCM10007854_00060 [Algimonas porphyrae]|uniref:Uncharacterized protein n=1 Tax=Algimonas porphyrae TaxID=1128113 RepID=A0ABQ5UV76_9PROT|nr:hypothetical protein GCM10007854_00060 [Algimonas porphyrae]
MEWLDGAVFGAMCEYGGGAVSVQRPPICLNERQREVLRGLLYFTEGGDWARPMDVGGWDASYHGRTLRQLASKGLAEVRTFGGIRRTNHYRITGAGRAALQDPA